MSAQLKVLWDGFDYKAHQITGINWMLKREAADAELSGGGGGILCDEMGLGKTIQMVGLIRNAPRAGPREQNLLVAPVAVLEQWKAVLRRTGLTVLVPARGGVSWEIEGDMKSQLAPRVCVAGYELVTRNPSLVHAHRWHRVIYDEAHRLGSGGTCYTIAKDTTARYKWLLTATPIVNSVRDLAHLFKVIGLKIILTDTLGPLEPYIPTHILCRTMNQLRAKIPDAPPPPVYKMLSLEFASEEEAEFYRGMTGIIQRRWRALDIESGQGVALEKLKLFMRLRQLSLHPQVYIEARKKQLRRLYTRPDWEGSSTKFEALRFLLTRDGGLGGNRWILFCHFRHEMELLRELLGEEVGIGRVQLYHGGLSAAEKQAVIEETHRPLDGQTDVLLVQLQSGGVGLNLQHFNRIAFTGPWWTKALMEQAVGRAVRIGQPEVVEVYHLRLKEEEAINIDAFMADKAEMKGALCRAVLNASTTAVTMEDLLAPPPLRMPVAIDLPAEVPAADGPPIEQLRLGLRQHEIPETDSDSDSESEAGDPQ
jgi:SNF2 family DNA or RNA helicase